MSQSPVSLEIQDSTLLVTLNRPEARNAIDVPLASGIADAMRQLDSDPDLRVAVIAGAGTTFSAGLDLRALLRGEQAAVAQHLEAVLQVSRAKPLIAAVEGHALAGGFELVLACDLIVAAEGAVFGLPEVKRGLVATGGGLLRLQRRIPYHHAMELALTGASVTAGRAHDLGLVNRVVPTGRAVEGARELAGQIAANAPLAVTAAKRITVAAADWDSQEAFERQAAIAEPIGRSADAAEGALAFTEKRTPQWTGQ